ncbi:MAG TPA: hypothetical protein VFT43_01690 [Candidatus Polarisedimenticolia bacterium]|nr:hypothetical protein [Candidatus Polarisedimenticolia bacterium]
MEGAPAEDRTEPPRVEEFGRFTRRAGSRSACVDIAGVAVEFDGLPEDLAERMAVAYGPYLLPPGAGAARPLRIEVLAAPVDYFLPPGFRRGREVYRMPSVLENGIFRSVSYRLASWFDIDRRVGQIALGTGDLDPAPRALENFLRSAVAWLALDQGGFFLHGASIVRGDRFYLFYGPSGAGKSTLAAMNREGRVNSDDLTLVLRRPEGLVAAGGPFRGTYREGKPVTGTWPVAGFYRLRKDETTGVRPDDGGCFADLLGNLPFVVDQMPRHPEIIDRVRALVDGVPLRYLHFRKDTNFWPAIDAGRSL